jgi:HEAT repeat protein
MISEFLFLEEDATKDEKSNYVGLKIEIRQLLKDDFNRKLLSEILLDLRKDISGVAQQALFKLYQDLGLHKDAFAKLSSWRWQVISKGILELTQMEVVEAYAFTTKFINDKRSTIRKQAEIATVTLRHEGINYFLDTTKYRISEWQQLKLLDVIRNKKDFQPPRFKAWLTSNNKYVVLFALRLIKYYNQNDANSSLVQLVKHKNNQIKEEAIACIKEFNVTESLDTLKLVFWNCSVDVKIAILDAIAQIGSDTDIEFLKLIEKKEVNFPVKSKALSSINSISPESIMPSKGIQKESRYKIPNDVIESVAKVQAEEYTDDTTENEAVLADNELIEAETMINELDMTAPADSNHGHEVDEEEENHNYDSHNEDDRPIPKEFELSAEKEAQVAIYKIEVVSEEIRIPEEQDQLDVEFNDWAFDHLSFLPLVVEKEKMEEVQKEDNAANGSFRSVFDINVLYEAVTPYKTEKPDYMDKRNRQTASFLDSFDSAELAFLPIVVDNITENEDSQGIKVEGKELELFEMAVEFEEVQYDILEKMDIETSDIIIEFDLDHHHELTDAHDGKVVESETGGNNEQYRTEEIFNLSVNYELVRSENKKVKLSDIEVIEPFIFSIKDKLKNISEMTLSNEEEKDDEIELPIENEQLLQKIIDDLVSFDTKPQDEAEPIDDSYINPDWDLDVDQLEFIPVSFEKDEEQPENYIKIEKNQNKRINGKMDIPKASIPKAIFGDIDFEATTRQLLNDLEEMGDQREIPFLKELLAHEKYDVFKERINNLIDTFNHVQVEEKIDSELRPFSVFQDLFRTCDTEAKLILLNEVVEVGDEKDVQFLEELSTDKSQKIRTKAFEVLHELKKKLGLESGISNVPPADENKTYRSMKFSKPMDVFEPKSANDPNDIFDLNFDLADDLDDNGDEKKNDQRQPDVLFGSFFCQIFSFSNKMLEKLNG